MVGPIGSIECLLDILLALSINVIPLKHICINTPENGTTSVC